MVPVAVVFAAIVSAECGTALRALGAGKTLLISEGNTVPGAGSSYRRRLEVTVWPIIILLTTVAVSTPAHKLVHLLCALEHERAVFQCRENYPTS